MEKINNGDNNVKEASRTYLINGDYIKFHTVLPLGKEIVEEYNINSGEIESRKVKTYTQTGKEIWSIEIGDNSFEIKDKEGFLIKENNYKNPIFIRKDTKNQFQYRIRNMHWNPSNYTIDVDLKTNEIIIKTLNKKYYKRFTISDLIRNNIPIDPKQISVDWANNTLIVSYNKPKIILDEENKIQLEIKRIKKEIEENPNKKYDSDCKQQ